MKIVQIKVGEEPKVTVVDNKLEAMQDLVGGYLEVVRLKNNIDLWLNDEGKLQELKPNIFLYYKGKQRDVVMGDVFFASSDNEGETVSLTDEQIMDIENRLMAGSIEDDDGQIRKVYRLDLE